MSGRMSLAAEAGTAAAMYSFPILKSRLVLERLQQLQIPIAEAVSTACCVACTAPGRRPRERVRTGLEATFVWYRSMCDKQRPSIHLQ
jgi:hypothetical protein